MLLTPQMSLLQLNFHFNEGIISGMYQYKYTPDLGSVKGNR